MNTIAQIEQNSLRMDIPEFKAGDTLKVHVKIREGEKQRIQIFQGFVLRRQGEVSGGIGVERTFPVHSPMVDKIELVNRGRVRRAKLYYMRNLRGKAARIRTIN